MDCKEVAPIYCCYSNGTITKTLIVHYEYGNNANGNTILVKTIYTEIDGFTVVDTSDGVVAAGECVSCNTPKKIEMYELVPAISGTYDKYGENVLASFINTNNPTVADGGGSLANTIATKNNTLGVPDGTIQDANQYSGSILYSIITMESFTPPIGCDIQNFKAYFYANANTSTAAANDGVFLNAIIENPSSLNLANVLPDGTSQTNGDPEIDISNYSSLAFSKPLYGINILNPTHTDSSLVQTTNIIDNFKRTGGWRNMHTLPLGQFVYRCDVPTVTYNNVANGIGMMVFVDDDSTAGTTPSIGLDSVRITYDYVRAASSNKFIRTICSDGTITDTNPDGTPFVKIPDSIIYNTEDYITEKICNCITESTPAILTRNHENYVITGTTPLSIAGGAISISIIKTSEDGVVNINGSNNIDYPLDYIYETYTDSVNEDVSILSAYTIIGSTINTSYKIHVIR